ncbi:MAG: carboxypeptidase regulatory-like domain-containing protein [Bacteroidetes bacterium]|nr:carboxypeptidase regulatory-like domain-containing protein [Bacteroidota bacterium]
MKKVKIFLASSAELDDDKEKFELFISKKNKDLFEKRIFLELNTWKDFISSIQEVRTQDEYNLYIRKSDISVFLFHTKIGRFTREEFDNAHKAFLSCKHNFSCKHKNKTPRIYTYFKNNKEETAEISNFRDHIDSLDHFYDSYDDLNDLFVKFGHQLDKLENEGRIIKPDSIDSGKIIKYTIYYFLLPLLVMSGVFFSNYYFQTTSLTVKTFEVPTYSIQGLPLKEAKVTIMYGEKSETKSFNEKDGFAPFTQIPSQYKGDFVKLHFEAKEYVSIDTSIDLNRFQNSVITLPVKRDNSLGFISGIVRDEDGIPIKDVSISVNNIEVISDGNGKFEISIPFKKQAEQQRIRAFKVGYKMVTYDIPVIPNVEVPIKLRKQ